MGSERRTNPRFPLVLHVQYVDTQTALDYTENLSATGLFIRTERRFAAGDRVSLVVSFPQLLEPVELVVEVVRCRDAEGDAPGGVAVRVPNDLPEVRAKLAEVTRLVAASGRKSEASYRVLLVEDNNLVATMYSAVLKKMDAGVEELGVEIVPDGAAAWARLLATPPVDLVVTDVYMPTLNGFELIEKIRSEPSLADLQVIVVSAGGEKEREKLAALGATLVLQKPVKYQDLVGTVRFLVDARRGRVQRPPGAAVGTLAGRPAAKPAAPAAEAPAARPEDPTTPRR